MTYDSPEWNPHDETLTVEEEKLRQQMTLLREIPVDRDRTIATLDVTICTSSRYSRHIVAKMRENVFISEVDVAKTRRRKGTVQVDELAKRWHISLDLAKRTIETTTQKGVRDYTNMSGTRRLRHLTQQLAYRPLNTICYTDTMFSKIPSLSNKHTCAQVYCTEFDWTKVYPMKAKSEAHYTLDMLHHQFGAFRVMIPDNAKELTQGAFRDKLRKAGTVIAPVEAYSPNQNRAESAIRELKRMYRRAMISSKAPEVLWDHCFQLMAEIRSHTALNMMRLGGETPTTHLTGETADISHLCQFEWYEYVWWLDVTDKLQNKKLGHYLGPSLNSGDAMCSKVLTEKGTTRVYSSVFPLSIEDRNSEVVKSKIVEYEAELLSKLRERAAGLEPINEEYIDADEDELNTPDYGVYHDENDVKAHEMPEVDDYDHGFFDKYIAAHIMIPDPDGVLRKAKVTKRKRDENGDLIGRYHRNPILDTGLYELEFDDGTLATYTANIIAENLYEQVDDEGRTHVIFDSITDHKKGEDAVNVGDGFV